MSLCRIMQRAGADLESHMDMHICTDACTHSNQVVRPEIG